MLAVDAVVSIFPRGRGMPLLIAAPLLAGCAAGMRTSVEEARVPPEPPDVTRLAVMPLVAEHGSEGVGPDVSLALCRVLGDRFPDLVVFGPEETADRLAASPAASTYGALLADYERTGVVESARLAGVTEALGVDHFLQVHASYLKEEFLDPVLFEDDVVTEDRQVLVVVVRLWGSAGPGPVWEAVVRTTSETDDFQHRERRLDELVYDLVSKLAESIPLG
jgi:hypothetical protein